MASLTNVRTRATGSGGGATGLTAPQVDQRIDLKLPTWVESTGGASYGDFDHVILGQHNINVTLAVGEEFHYQLNEAYPVGTFSINNAVSGAATIIAADGSALTGLPSEIGQYSLKRLPGDGENYRLTQQASVTQASGTPFVVSTFDFTSLITP